MGDSSRPDWAVRHIHVKGASVQSPDDPKQRPYLAESNEVTTSRYHWWNFLVLNLIEQFSIRSNFYFLCIGILQIIPQVSTTGGVPTQYQPLLFILFVSGLRAASEDWNKHKADAKRNSYPYEILSSGGQFKTVKSGDLRVGNIVKVKQDDMIPCDVVFIGSSHAKGHCFIDKANLNGETKLEVLSSLHQTRDLCKNLDSLDMSLQYEGPNGQFDSLRGQMRVNGGEVVNVDGRSLLMRETTLRNTEYVYGLIIYCGNSTKIQMSNAESGKPKVKKSDIMTKVERYLLGNLTFQILLCLCAAIASGSWLSLHREAWYLDVEGVNAALAGVAAFFSWFILMAQMVPISLTVTAEMVKFLQSQFIQWDLDLYYEKINRRAKCNSSTIHEDLGMISYIFSDKTGTLTQNRMEFRFALLPTAEYGSKETEIAKSVTKRKKELENRKAETSGSAVEESHKRWTELEAPFRSQHEQDPYEGCWKCCNRGGACSPEGMCGCFIRNCWNNRYRRERVDHEDYANANQFNDAERKALLKALWGPCPSGGDPKQHELKQTELRVYMTHMALSNTVKPYDDKGELKFQAESAEELAMSLWARSCGFLKVSQNPTTLEITEIDYETLEPKGKKEIEKYNHVGTLGFTSKRARVTVFYECIEGAWKGKILAMSKGQDTVMLPLLQAMDAAFESQLLSGLEQCAVNGLRTLLCAQGLQPMEWWDTRKVDYQLIVDGGSADAESKTRMHDFFEKLERDAQLTYIGCMGLEDQLQNLVPEAIHDFLAADIKVWMITGDKLETAKNIGIACNLIDPDMSAVFTPEDDLATCIDKFQNSRLIEVTGQWANLTKDKEELTKLFQSLDPANKGFVDVHELNLCLAALKLPKMDDAKAGAIFEQDSKEGGIDLEHFIKVMEGTKLSEYEAVKTDIEEGIQRYKDIEDHKAFPISTLVNRDAFLVMFPGKHATGQTPEADLEKLRAKFFELASLSKSVVFARAEPAMKKKMVTEIQLRVPQATTLAIGDGANDTDMIMAAHVGVGIAGVEGTAATNSADYAIGTFRMLHTLLFVHGFWSYNRMTALVVIIFFKAILMAFCGYYFGFLSAFSGQQFFNDPPFICYNVVFTALPVMAVSVLGKALNRTTLQNNPACYKEQRGTAFTLKVFLSWVFRAILYATIIFWIPMASITGQRERTHVLWWYSTTIIIILVFVPTFVAAFEMSNINFIHILTLLSSPLSLFVVLLIVSGMARSNPDLYYVVYRMWTSPEVVLTSVITIAIPCLIELTVRYVQRDLRPTMVQILQERVRLKRVERRADHVETQDPTKVEVFQKEALEWGNKYPNANRERKKTEFRNMMHATSSANISMDTAGGGVQLRKMVVRSMLRFRNLTGAQYDSAAQARFQNHDEAGKYGKQEEKGD